MFTAKIERRRHKRLPTAMQLAGPSKVKVGLPSGKADGSVIQIGIWNHFGTSRGIPERPFLSNAMRDNRGKYKQAMATSARKILLGETGMTTVLNKLGIAAQADIQGEITSLMTPPNAPSTVRQKGFNNPLIETGRLRSSITWSIED